MIIIKRDKCIYYIKEESITVGYGIQYISYNVYALQNRKRFKDFKARLLDSYPNEYAEIRELLSLAMEFGLKGMVGRKPLLHGDEEYLP